MGNSLLITIIIFVAGIIITTIYYAETNQSKAIIVGFLITIITVVLCVLMNLNSGFMLYKDDVEISNEYISLHTGDLLYRDVTSESDCAYKGHIYEKTGIVDNYLEYIDIVVFDNPEEDVDRFLTSSGTFYEYMLGYCAGSFGEYKSNESNLTAENVRYIESKGIYISDEFCDYDNTFIYEGKTKSGDVILGVIRVLYISNDKWIIEKMRLEDVSYDYFLNSDNTNIVSFRNAFLSVKQNVVEKN